MTSHSHVSTLQIDGVAIGGIKSISLKIDGETVEVTTKDDALWKARIAGMREGSLEVTCLAIEADGGQEDIMDAITAATPTSDSYTYRPLGTGTGNKEYVWNGFVTNYSDESPDGNAALEFSFSIEFTGAPTIQDQV